MAKINVLPKSVAELIAAGEVVERPSSAVKELIENSIDAGANVITVEIKNGGISYIRITDNGCGIEKEDVRNAFVSHATSKISTEYDLDSIFTLGFRGEALSSIAAVSRLSMLTKSEAEEFGTSFEIEGGVEKSFEEAGCPNGTTIVIKDLFFNTPARKKFLKKDSTEGYYISDIVSKTAISHPDIRFSFIKDGKQILSTPGNGDLSACIYSVLGKDIADGLIPCEYEHKGLTVSGFISKPLNNRPNRNLQYCFVNGRFVRVPSLSAALDEAYKNRIMVGKFPMCFLFLNIPPSQIDVNVHPAKTEIRFSEDRTIFETFYYAAKSALNKGDINRPSVKLNSDKNLLQKSLPKAVQISLLDKITDNSNYNNNLTNNLAVTQNSDSKIFEDLQTKKSFNAAVNSDESKDYKGVLKDTSGVFDNLVSKNEVLEKNKQLFGNFYENNDNKNFNEKRKLIDISCDEEINISIQNNNKIDYVEKKEDEALISKNNNSSLCDYNKTENKVLDNFTYIGEIFNTYLLVQVDNKLLIIDKHASHERMIFNKLTEKGYSKDAQILLVPITVTLSSKEYSVVLENMNVFEDAGFLIEDFGEGSVLVRQVPIVLSDVDVKSLITEMAGELLRGNLRPVPEKLTQLYHSIACRSAVKAGDVMKNEEIIKFIEMILNDDNIRYCPHGRPVIYELSKHEIEKQFGRV